MGVYEDLLKRKKIIEDEQGNVVSNNVVDKNIRRQLNDNNIQTYNIEETKSSINKMKNVIQNTATKTIWDRMQDVIISNKSIKPNNIIDSFRNNMSNSINEELNPTNKNKNIIQDTGSLAKLVGLGASTGGKEVFNYIESANENNFSGYNDLRKRQFLTSQKVNEEDKAKAKTQNNLLLSSNGIKTADENRVETNLVKKAIRDSINKDNEKIQEEQSKMSNQATKKLAEIAPSMGQMLPGMALNAVNPILGTAYFTTSAGGGYIDDALNRGMNEQQAFKYGTVMGALEGASESIITGQQLSKVKKAFTGKEISKKLLNSYGFNIFENAVQEAVMEPAQEITAGIVGDKADWSNMGSRMLESGFNGALMGAISNGVTFGLEKSGNVYNKIKNGESITEAEYKEALQENIDRFGKDAVENAMKKGATEVYQEINNLQQQSTQNEQILPTQQINQEQNNVAQNGNTEQIMSTQNENRKIAIDEINNSRISTQEKQQMIEALNNIEEVSNEDIYAIRNVINEANKINQLPTDLNYKDNREARQKYAKYKNDNSNYDSTIVNEVLDTIPTNRNGRRTVKQWLQVANEIGTRIADKSDAEIEKIAYRSWFEEQPTKNITRYDNQAKTNVGFQKLTSDEWLNTINNAVNETRENSQQNIANNQEQNKIAENGNIEQINSMLINKQVPTQKYQYEKTGNSKIDTMNEQASQYFNNSEKTQNYMKMLAKIVQDKNIDIRFDGNLTDGKGNMANGKYENGVITINPNAQNTGEFIAIHELTHAIGTDQMRNIIENYRKSNTEFDNAVQSLLQNYNTTELTDEAMADVSAQLLGNQEYINNLAQTNPSLFRKIYNEIKYLWHQFTGYKNQNQFLEDLKYKWEQAYRRNNELNDTSNYYIQPLEEFNEMQYNDTKGLKLNNIEEYALREIVNSDSNIKPGINKVETTNATYTIYYKSTDDFKVITRKVDKSAGKLNKRNDYTRGKARYSLPYSESNGNQETARSNDEISNINKTRESERTGSTTSSSDNIRNSIENSEKSSFNLSENMQKRLNELKSIDTSKMGFLERAKIKHEIRSLEAGFNTVEEYEKVEREKREKALKEAEKEREERRKKIKQQEKEHEGYQMTHRPTESGAYASDISANGFIPKDVYEHPEWYFDMNRDFSKESFEVIKKIKGNPEAEITIYRATPSNTINKGDWVTLSRKYAEYHNESNLGGKGNIVELRVKAKDIQYAGDDINEFGYFPENEKYSLTTKDWQSYLDKNIESKGTKTNLQDIKLPIKKQLLPTNNLANNNVNENTITNNYAQSNENNTQNEQYQATKGESINWNGIERPEGKIRKHYRSIIESSNTTAEAKAIAKEMMGTDTYIPESNNSQIERADAYIEEYGVEDALARIEKHIKNDEITYDNKGLLDTLRRKKVSVDDIALGERLIQYYSKTGDAKHLQDAIHYTAIMGTEAGRAVQVMALLNHMTPQGQLTWLDRSVTKMNDELKNKNKNKSNTPQFEITQEMKEKILNTKSTEEMYDVIDEIYEELGQQVPKSKLEQIDEWRYFSMLANVKTHGRNIIGNVAMHFTQRAKDKVAGAIEGTVAKFNPEMERTHTLRRVSEEVKQFAENDLKNRDVQTQLGMNEDKYNPQSRLQKARKTFKNDLLNNTLGKAFKGNSTLLEVEDNLFLKPMYKKALGEYITANKIDINKITDAQLSKARKYAVQQAKEATFHQESVLATTLNQLGKRSNLAKFALDASVPFKKTPINVAKTGIQYSPVGIMTTALYDTYQLKKGNISVNKYIDNISKGLTGTGITFLGYALAEAGILKASGSDDDRKEKYEEEQGKQTYSIEIGGKTYSLDWLSPVGVPLFIGVETNQQFKNKKKEKNSKSTDDENDLSQILKGVSNVVSASSKAVNPISEMSMISGLTNILSSFNKENAWANMALNAGKSYVNQFVPTALGQIARTTDDYERSTKSTKTDPFEKAVDSTINQIKSKIPGLRQTLPTKTDIWGKDIKQDANLPFRAFNNFINPSKVQDVSTDIVDKELNSLYAKTGESSIIPKAIEKTYTIDGTTYRMTDNEYAKYYKKYGETSYELINGLINSKGYKDLTNEQKQKAIENVYSYAKESNKLDYAKNNNLEVDESTLYKTIKELKDKGGNQSSYLNYTAKTAGMEKEKDKNKVLANATYDDKTKSIIYLNGTGKDDKLYNNIQNSNININQYLTYKIQESEEKFLSNKDSNGKSISGSAKEKIYNYVNTNITGYNNKLLLLGQKYKLTKSEQESLAKYIYQITNNTDERNNLFEYYSKNFTVKDGKVYYK